MGSAYQVASVPANLFPQHSVFPQGWKGLVATDCHSRRLRRATRRV